MSLATPNVVVVEEATCEELEKVLINDDPEKFFQVGAQLPVQEKLELVVFLKNNIDVFAWDAYEAPRVDLSFICHHLNVNPAAVPRRQPPWRSSKEHSEAVKEEVLKLKKAGAIKEVFYPEWLAHIVIMKKKNGKWRGYHQIPLALGDQEKTDFITPTGNYHYKMLRKYKLRLNASKCSFGVGSGKFLVYMVTHKGIKVNPAQVRAINSLQPPRNPKEVQKLIRMTAALNRFISRSPPIMSWPKVDETLFAYIAVAIHAVSLVLVRDDNGVQKPVYYVSKSLQEAEVRYLPLEKAILAVVHATRKLLHYFQSHTVVVLTQLPLKVVLRSANYLGRIVK
ncbi:uncharacterized protein LOC142631401 [Castanea sativa]|uniref:uncharacterized protein LOC142631401 n=1 Tax=Castanea sativa TaxID=21020 RepID=UPI003F64ED3B